MMMLESKTRVSLAAALLVGLATLGSARNASASSAFPASLQKALTTQFPGVTFCVPLCTACHLTTLGGPHNLNVFGKNLFVNGQLAPTNDNADAKVDAAIKKYFASTPPPNVPQVPTKFVDGSTRPFYDSDADGLSDYTELQNLDSPSIPLPLGEKEFCPDIAYGCGARIAAAPPPVDRLGLFSAGLVVLGLAAFRRLKRAPRAR